MEWILLVASTFVASTVQALTGFGFGLLATSAFLLLLNSTDAIHLVIIITLIMCLYIWPKIKNHVSIPLLIWLSIGSIGGFPIGIVIFRIMNLQTLKFVVAVLILLLTAQAAWQLFEARRQSDNPTKDNKNSSRAITAIVGIISAAMSVSLAMPGPVVMIYLSRSKLTKDEIRATILTFFIFAYIGALAIQTIVVGVETEIYEKAAVLTIPTIAGVHVGHHFAKLMNPDIFRVVVLLLLASTGTFMLASIYL